MRLRWWFVAELFLLLLLLLLLHLLLLFSYKCKAEIHHQNRVRRPTQHPSDKDIKPSWIPRDHPPSLPPSILSIPISKHPNLNLWLTQNPNLTIMSPQSTVKDAVVVKCMHLSLFPKSDLQCSYTNKCFQPPPVAAASSCKRPHLTRFSPAMFSAPTDQWRSTSRCGRLLVFFFPFELFLL